MLSFVPFVARLLMGGFEASCVDKESVIVGKHNVETQNVMEI